MARRRVLRLLYTVHVLGSLCVLCPRVHCTSVSHGEASSLKFSHAKNVLHSRSKRASIEPNILVSAGSDEEILPKETAETLQGPQGVVISRSPIVVGFPIGPVEENGNNSDPVNPEIDAQSPRSFNPFDSSINAPVSGGPAAVPIMQLDTEPNWQAVPDAEVEPLDHSPLECSGAESLEGSVEEICTDQMQKVWSCDGKCATAIQTPCSCDINCLLHNTCCHDFEEFCPDVAASSREELASFKGLRTVCDPFVKSPLVSECPEEASEEEKRLCSLGREPGSSLLDVAPVSDDYYLWSFKNKACWRCWHTGHGAIKWRLNVTMSRTNRMAEDYRLDSLTSFIFSNPHLLQWYPPRDIASGLCSDKVVSHCSACGADNATVDLCANGPHAIVQVDSVLYKNLYCYLCSKHRRPDVKVLCRKAEVGSKQLHGMNFPVTMILPDGDGAEEVELVQTKETIGRYYWDLMSCSLTHGTCRATKCMPTTLINNGRCDAQIRPLKLAFRVCSAEIVDGDLECRAQAETFEAAYGTRPSTVLRHVTEYANELITSYHRDLNFTVVDSKVTDNVGEGLMLSVLWRMPPNFETVPAMLRQFRYEVMNLVHHTRAAGLISVCSLWSKMNREVKPEEMYDYSCDMSMLCGQSYSLTGGHLKGVAATHCGLDSPFALYAAFTLIKLTLVYY